MAELQAEGHTHCNTCFKLWCSAEPVEGLSCLNVRCPQDCGVRLHACKIDDHMTRCPNTRVECFNKINGCPASMMRRTAASHLIHCPANVVQCGLGFRMDDYMRHFKSDNEHDHHCASIIAEKIARKVAAEKLAEEAEYDVNIPADNYTVLTEKELAELREIKKTKCEEAMKTRGSLFVRPRLRNPTGDLDRVPWQNHQRLLSDVDMDITTPTSPLPPDMPMSPLSPLPNQEFHLSQSLEALPFPVLKHIGRFLDPKDLASLSLSSHFLRRVCASLLQECGMVTMKWDRQVDDTWVPTQKIWQFAVDSTRH